MAGRMLMGILPAKKVIEAWEKLCNGFFLLHDAMYAMI